jgi:hypothetical protein
MNQRDVAKFVQQLQLAVWDYKQLKGFSFFFDSSILCFLRSGYSPLGFMPQL